MYVHRNDSVDRIGSIDVSLVILQVLLAFLKSFKQWMKFSWIRIVPIFGQDWRASGGNYLSCDLARDTFHSLR